MSLPAPISGIVPPLVTPLLEAEVLDIEGLERLLARIVRAGCSGVFVLGSTGEAQALSYRLRLEVVRETCRIVNGAIPVLAGISDTSVTEAIKLGRAAVDAGASALVSATPFYFRMSQADLIEHARMLARSLPAPLFLYNMPGLTKLHYEPATVAVLSHEPNISGFKDSSGDLIFFQQVLSAVAHRPDFAVLIGPEELLPQAVALGGHGGITGGANLYPELYVALYCAARNGRSAEVRELQSRVFRLSERLYHLGDPATSYIRGLKCALALEGICSELPAPPLRPFSPEERDQMRERLQELTALSEVRVK